MALPTITYRCTGIAAELGKEFPYYQPLLERTRFRTKKDIDTMEINCSLIVSFNEKFVKSLNSDQLKAVILHEAMHYANGHHQRYMDHPLKDTYPHILHNIAMDLEINEFITDLPRGSFKASDYGLPEKKSYEEYLRILSRDMPPGLAELIEKGTGDDTSGYPGTDVDISDYNGIYVTVLEDLLRECEKAGKAGGGGDVLRQIKKKKYHWEKIFKNLLTGRISEAITGNQHSTYKRMNRRFMDTDIVKPSYVDYKKRFDLVIGVDVSGSMSHELIEYMYGTIKSIIDHQNIVVDITILEADTQVQKMIKNWSPYSIEVEGIQGGGTDMECIPRFVEEMNIPHDLIIIMTDSYCEWSEANSAPLYKKTVVLTNHPDEYKGAYTMYPVEFLK